MFARSWVARPGRSGLLVKFAEISAKHRVEKGVSIDDRHHLDGLAERQKQG